MKVITLVKINFMQFFRNYFILGSLIIGIPIMLWLGFVFSNDGNILKFRVGIDIKDSSQREYVIQNLGGTGRFECLVLDSEEISADENADTEYVATVTAGGANELFVTGKGTNTYVEEIEYILGLRSTNNHYISALQKTTGFLIVFILMISKLLQGSHFVERENGILCRLFSGNITWKQYIFSQLLANFLEVFSSVVLMTVICSVLFHNIFTWNLGVIVGIEFVICIFAASFSNCIFYSFDDKITIEFVSSLVILVSSILGGCLIDMKDQNIAMRAFRDILPQKSILNILKLNDVKSYFYISIWIVALLIIGYLRGKRIK